MTDEESNRYLLRKYFPVDDWNDDNETRRTIKEDNAPYEEDVELDFCSSATYFRGNWDNTSSKS